MRCARFLLPLLWCCSIESDRCSSANMICLRSANLLQWMKFNVGDSKQNKHSWLNSQTYNRRLTAREKSHTNENNSICFLIIIIVIIERKKIKVDKLRRTENFMPARKTSYHSTIMTPNLDKLRKNKQLQSLVSPPVVPSSFFMPRSSTMVFLDALWTNMQW
jgi:hypothetical protein